LDRTDQRVEVELLSQGDVHAPETATDGRRDRAFERDLVLADRLEDMRRQRRPELLDRAVARLLDVPVELHAVRFEDAYRRVADLRPDAVAGHKCDRVPSHAETSGFALY